MYLDLGKPSHLLANIKLVEYVKACFPKEADLQVNPREHQPCLGGQSTYISLENRKVSVLSEDRESQADSPSPSTCGGSRFKPPPALGARQYARFTGERPCAENSSKKPVVSQR